MTVHDINKVLEENSEEAPYPNLKTTKAVVGLIVQVGAGRIIKKIIENNITAESRIDRLTIPAASYALAGIVKMKVREYSDSAIDGYAKSWTKAKKVAENLDVQKEMDKIDGALEETVETLKKKQEKRKQS